MTAFSGVIDALFADPNIGRDAVYTSDGGAPVRVRVVSRQADVITDFGDARLWSETTRVDLRVAEVANPCPGDRLEVGGDAFLIQGEPVRDRERLVWTVGLRPAPHDGSVLTWQHATLSYQGHLLVLDGATL